MVATGTGAHIAKHVALNIIETSGCASLLQINGAIDVTFVASGVWVGLSFLFGNAALSNHQFVRQLESFAR